MTLAWASRPASTEPHLAPATRPLTGRAPGRARVMGILNVTPDSFHDGGRHVTPEAAVVHARQLVAEGASIIDVGGESSRPGARPVSADEEIRRVVPVIERLRTEFAMPISIDTTKPEVMRAAVAAGATMINDINALRQPGALSAAAELGVPVCLMHMQGEPATMQERPSYEDTAGEVRAFLLGRAEACLTAGIDRRHIILDPGFGFGKLLRHNLALFRALPQLVAEGWPVLVGVSRKSMIGQILGDPAADRLAGSLALALLACQRGATILRVHDVGPTVQALAMLDSIEKKQEIQ